MPELYGRDVEFVAEIVHKAATQNPNGALAKSFNAKLYVTEDGLTCVSKADTTAKAPYGDVTYADPGLQEDGKKRYPLDTEEHIRAAWSYINEEKNASKYSAADLKTVKANIAAAMKKIGADTEGSD